MSSCRRQFMFLGLLFCINLAQSTEYVPVYMWSKKTFNDKVPALTKISEDAFKDDLLEHLKDYDSVIVFAEQTLSPEDFAQLDQRGGKVFPHIQQLRKSLEVSYLPYVQNPVKSLKHLDASVSEISVTSLSSDLELPKTDDILIVNLDDVKEDETRIDMLKRHDAIIKKLYTNAAASSKKVLGLYTAYHPSWVVSEDVTSRKRRSLLQVKETATAGNDTTGFFFSDANQFLYLTQLDITTPSNNYTNLTLDSVSSNSSAEGFILVTMSASNGEVEIELLFDNSTSSGYWNLNASQIIVNKQNISITSDASIYAPRGFSYHCGDQVFSNHNTTVLIKNFQLQIFFDDPTNNTQFGDAYDCVGFTSIPIWSGLFVTAILLLILTFGITMMMDIRTMDKFDDAKGKTITINAE